MASTRDLEVFLAVVREGSFGRAAQALVLSQPTVSERVVRLEREIGVQLFTRTTQGAMPTAAGAAFEAYAVRCLDVLVEGKQAAAARDDIELLRVAVHANFAHRALPLVLAGIEARPCELRLRDVHSEDAVTMLLDGVVDLAFVVPSALPPGIASVAMPADPLVWVCAADHPLAGRRRLTVDGLGDATLALNTWGPEADELRRQLDAVVPAWRIRELSDHAGQLLLARAHGHVALVGWSVASMDLADGRLVELTIGGFRPWRLDLVLAHRAPVRGSAARAVIEAATPGSRVPSRR